MREMCLCMLSCCVLAGCNRALQPEAQEVRSDFHPTVEKEVAAVIRAYMAGHSTARCNDVTPVSKFVRDGMIFVTKSEIRSIPLTATERDLKDMVCGWDSHAGIVDSVVVDALSRDIAVAAWLYHDEVRLKSGEIKRYKGSALMTLVRSAEGWKITSTMAAYE